MYTRTIEQTDWQPYFAFISKIVSGSGAAVEILGYSIGAQHDEKQRRIWGLTYDPLNDTLEVFADPLDHQIGHPIRIRVEEEGFVPKAIEVTQENGDRQIISFSEPSQLPLMR